MGNDTPVSERRLRGMINYQDWNKNVKRALEKRNLGSEMDRFLVPGYSGRQAADLIPAEKEK